MRIDGWMGGQRDCKMTYDGVNVARDTWIDETRTRRHGQCRATLPWLGCPRWGVVSWGRPLGRGWRPSHGILLWGPFPALTASALAPARGLSAVCAGVELPQIRCSSGAGDDGSFLRGVDPTVLRPGDFLYATNFDVLAPTVGQRRRRATGPLGRMDAVDFTRIWL